MEMQQSCSFCGKMYFSSKWAHYKECEKVPEIKMEIHKWVTTFVPSEGRNWKDLLESKFEPHILQSRWNNIECPFCFKPCKDIFHTFTCPYVYAM